VNQKRRGEIPPTLLIETTIFPSGQKTLRPRKQTSQSKNCSLSLTRSQSLTSLPPFALQDLSPPPRFHTRPKTTCSPSFPLAGLISTLHDSPLGTSILTPMGSGLIGRPLTAKWIKKPVTHPEQLTRRPSPHLESIPGA